MWTPYLLSMGMRWSTSSQKGYKVWDMSDNERGRKGRKEGGMLYFCL